MRRSGAEYTDDYSDEKEERRNETFAAISVANGGRPRGFFEQQVCPFVPVSVRVC
jgi:hypothetical protein